ncbi:MAG TPA: glycosyltransferase family 4 protein [Vicinamibacterales bacterium]|jgi:glycosyltransferase involved in cell wall biosynthesis|nr:glycosyltransferase family 4 protein [Vicinamibacterales bacterium]
MRITYLTTSGQLGGAETSLLEILASVRAAEPAWRLSVVAPADGPFVERARALGVDARVLPFPRALARVGESHGSNRGGRLRFLRAGLSVAGHARALGRLLNAENPDVVHSNGFKAHVLGALARPAGAALVWHVHDYVSGRARTAQALGRVAGRASAIVTNSESVSRDVKSTLRPRAPVHVMYNAVDLARFAPEGPQLNLDAAAGLPPAAPGTVRVGLVATFGRWKGHETFFDAIARLPRALPIRAFVIGDSLYETDSSQFRRTDLQARVSELQIADRVGFTGFAVDAAAAMRALDVVVHASVQPEPFGMVIAEAMACGRPVVVSLAGGAAEIVRDGVDALGHAPGDAAALADRLSALVRDPGLRARLGRAARTAAEARFDRARLARELAPLYTRLARAA